MATIKGQVKAISISEKRGTQKTNVPEAELKMDFGIDLLKLPIGTKLKIGLDTELEITQIGKECHSRCEIFEQIGDCIMPREGVFAKVTKPGAIKVGDGIRVLND